jgi:hypothetical protein
MLRRALSNVRAIESSGKLSDRIGALCAQLRGREESDDRLAE